MLLPVVKSCVRDATCTALVSQLSDYDALVEVGIGRRTAVAEGLTDRGCAVTATDIHEYETPAGVQFVRDDVTAPDRSVYASADAIYALNLPPELHRPAWTLARNAGVPLHFTTLGVEQPTIPVDRKTVPDETVYTATGPANHNG